jgi:low temperature requirement protein LtrA
LTADPPAPGVEPERSDGGDPSPVERATSSVELLWDLVFVFAVTQVTTLLADRPSGSTMPARRG